MTTDQVPARKKPARRKLEVEDVRRELADVEYHAAKEKISRAESALEDVKSLLLHVPFLQNGKLSAGTIEYAAFRVETLSLIFETARQTFFKVSSNGEVVYEQFLADLGDEVGLTFARDLVGRLLKHDLLFDFQDPRKLLNLWASFENDTGAGETTIAHYSQDQISIRLKNNPLRRAETQSHAHCGFYKNYLCSLVNEILTVRARFIVASLEGTEVRASNVISVTEQSDAEDQCVFILRCRPEKLNRAFDYITKAHDQFYRLKADEDFSVCMKDARAALITAQMEAINIEAERAPKQLHAVYKGLVPPRLFKQMDETYQRVSKALHPEAKSSGRMQRKQAWDLLRDVRRCVYGLELLELDYNQQATLRDNVAKLDRLFAIEGLAEKTVDLDPKEKHEFKGIMARVKKGEPLNEEQQKTLINALQKLGSKAWETARPILTEIVTPPIKLQFKIQ